MKTKRLFSYQPRAHSPELHCGLCLLLISRLLGRDDQVLHRVRHTHSKGQLGAAGHAPAQADPPRDLVGLSKDDASHRKAPRELLVRLDVAKPG